MPGSRYTKLGMVCIPSRMGRIRLSAIRLRAPTTPSGRPIETAMATATTINATVSIVFAQRSMKPMNSRASAVNTRSRQRPTAKESSARPITTTGQGVHFNTLSMLTSAYVTAVLSPSNSQAPSLVIHWTESSMAPLATCRTVLSRVREPSLEVWWDTVVGKSISGPQNRRLTSRTTTAAATPIDQR